MDRTKRVLLVVVVAVVASATMKGVTLLWHRSAEVAYEKACKDLNWTEGTSKNTLPEMDRKDTARDLGQKTQSGMIANVANAVKRLPCKVSNKIERLLLTGSHVVNGMPNYVKALIVFALAVLVDEILVWIIIAVFLMKISFFLLKKQFNRWIDGDMGYDLQVERLANGEIVIHLRQESEMVCQANLD